MSILCVLLMTGWANWPSFKKDCISSRLDPSPGQRWGGGFCSPQITVFLWGRPAVPGTSCQNSTQGSQIPALFPPHPHSWTSHMDSGQFLGRRKGGSSQIGKGHLGLHRVSPARDGPGQFPARLNMRLECGETLKPEQKQLDSGKSWVCSSTHSSSAASLVPSPGRGAAHPCAH